MVLVGVVCVYRLHKCGQLINRPPALAQVRNSWMQSDKATNFGR